MIDVVYMPHPGLDQLMLRDLLTNSMWIPTNGFEFNETTLDKVTEGAVIVVPGAVHTARRINMIISQWKWAVVIMVSDETNIFEIDKLKHSNMKLWVQTPRADINCDATLFGVGYGYAREYAPRYLQEYSEKTFDVFISGQNTHARRNVIFDRLNSFKNLHKDKTVIINETAGFTQGFSQQYYFSCMANAKVVPCPSGAFSPDSFRLYEALEYGCIPIADEKSPKEEHDSEGYWDKLFDSPIPILRDDNLTPLLKNALTDTKQKANSIYAWWQQQKREYAYKLHQDIATSMAGANIMPDAEANMSKITAVVPVSPWKSHPDTRILIATLNSIRYHLPEAEIIVTFDGVREEQEDRRAAYEEFVKQMLWEINFNYGNVLPIVFKEHTHQVGMMREAMKYAKTPIVMYVEGDSPLTEDRIDWDKITDKLMSGSDVVRLYNKKEIPKEHEYLMLSDMDDEFVQTAQWSQQPHLATKPFYKRALEYFGADAKAFIEEKIYYIGVKEARAGNWKMYIYRPEDKEPRSYHLDGREGEDQFLESQVF